MKKRLLSTIIIAILVVTISVSLVACGEEKNENALNCELMFVDLSGTVVASYEIETESKYLSGVLNELKSNADNKFDCDISGGFVNTFTYDGTVYGNAITSDFVMMFSDVNDAALSNPVWGTVTVDNKIYLACAVGITEMTIQESAVYVFAVQHIQTN